MVFMTKDYLLPELEQIEQIIASFSGKGSGAVRTQVLGQSPLFPNEASSASFPIYKLSFGNPDPKAPCLGIIGGVHGLERIGAQVAVALLKQLVDRMTWDRGTQNLLEEIRIFFIPVVNPVGIYKKRRSNPFGVDLMRNAPVEAEGKVPFLLGGHRISKSLPWFRGLAHEKMEVEAQALIDGVIAEGFQSRFLLTLDLHSGFGFQDQLWFPYAKSTKPWDDIAIAHAFKDILDRSLPHHFYAFEPQAKNYTTHGDLWDYLYEQFKNQQAPMSPEESLQSVYLPLCLEMGSWMWVRKNPWQIFSAEGVFNPMISHRQARTLRRHLSLFELMQRLARNTDHWLPRNFQEMTQHQLRAKELWYE